MWVPKLRSASTTSGEAPVSSAPIDAAQPRSAPVLPRDMARQSCRETSLLVSNAMSSACPAIICWVAPANADAAPAASGVPSSRRTCMASAISASPAMIAGPTPNSIHTVGR